VTAYLQLHEAFQPPYERFDNAMLAPDFPAQLDTVSRLWFRCGYRPGIAAYLNFFLLRDFITTHDERFPPRFRSLGSMAKSFYQTDLFIREVTDSGRRPSGGISSARVRAQLQGIQHRHARLGIPPWMQTYFGFSLVENVEKQCAPLSTGDLGLHLRYMATTFRIMGLRFSENRPQLEQFARQIEAEQAAITPRVAAHSRNILRIGEMIGVPSSAQSLLPMLPAATRAVFEPVYPRVRPGLARRWWSRLVGRLVLPKAVGARRPLSTARRP
jgi:hypothetical protein